MSHRPHPPTTLPLPAVLTQLIDAKAEMALVIDEYGGPAGVVTLEDLRRALAAPARSPSNSESS